MTPIFQFLAILFMSISWGCAVYAPPVRTTHTGAPGRLEGKEQEITAGAAQLFYDEYPGVQGGVGQAINDNVTLEGGLGGQVDQSVMAYGGVRITPKPFSTQRRPIKLAFDLEGGVGFGVGGRRDTGRLSEGFDGEPVAQKITDDGLRWHERAAGGLYTGTGIGFHVKWFDLFARARYQLAAANNIPPTHFFSALLGFQFGGTRFHTYIGAGPAAYFNRIDDNIWFFGEFGVGVKL